MPRLQRALVSVTDKTGIVEFASALSKLGIEIVSTGGTFRVLKDAGISPLREVADVTRFPEMLDGRVKTIHPVIAGGILAMRSRPEHMASIGEHGIPLIDLVVVNLYEFGKVAAKADASREELIENIDIGGPTMIRAAAKNWQDVAVVTSPADYAAIIKELQEHCGALSPDTHWSLAKKAFSATAAYDRAISLRLTREENNALPEILDVRAPRRLALRYGENPHQAASLYSLGNAGIAGAEQLQGKELSFNNLVDLDAAWQLVQEFDGPASAIIKHTNPCGCAEGSSLAESYRLAFECDPISPFGGVLAFNREVDAETAKELAKILIDAIAAPSYSAEALAVLSAKKNLRLLRVQHAAPDLTIKSISGGYLAETPDTGRFERVAAEVRTKRAPTEQEWAGLIFAMKVAKHVKSNAIVYARAGQTLGIGAGQTSRVDSVKVGAMRAVLPLKDSVLASDAFFPFPDGVEEAANHGVTAIIQPGGSVKDSVVVEAADRLGLAMVFTGMRHFRH
jgi:phosphoribosylaminoimidazolecarboxamide formyltransferase / IMP cyclohydrolase